MEKQQSCNNCKKFKELSDFGIRKDQHYYKECSECREKKKRKDSIDHTLTEDIPIIEEKKKRENRPTISQQKQATILSEQNYKCRGPDKNECPYYECLMNVHKKRCSDKKSVDPQYDHIIRWKEGGNCIGNIQALCPNCHSEKTKMENIITEDENALQSPLVKSIYECLSKPKYINNDDDDDSSDDDDFIFTNNRVLRRRKT